MYDLGCMLVESRSFVVLDGLSGLYGLKYEVQPLAGCYCTCALINWSILLQLVSEQDSILIATCVFKSKVLFFKTSF